jgi:periplasmic protein TonB
MRKARANVRSFLPHRRFRATPAQRALAQGSRAVVLELVTTGGHLSRARRSRLRVAPALAASLVLHGMAVPLFLYLASLPVARTDSDDRIAVDVVERPRASPPVEVQPSAMPAVGPRQHTRKQIPPPRQATRISPPVAPSVETPAQEPHLLPTSQASSQRVTTAATAAVPTTTVKEANVLGGAPRPLTAASLARTATAPSAEIEGRLRAATAGCYPYAAVRANLEGVTRLAFCVGGSGMAERIQIAQSSGSRLLDNAARDCILPAAMPFPPANDLCVTVPIRFQLRP